MAASQADIGYGALVEARSGPDTTAGYVEIAEVTDLTPPSDTVDEFETTHMQSPNGQKEFTSGLSDPGTMTMTINYVEGGETDLFILAWKSARETRDTRITYKSGRKQTISAFVKTYAPAIPVQGVKKATLTLRCTGGSTWE